MILSLCTLWGTAHTSWDWHCSTLKIAFHALICSKVNYAAPAWKPWLSATNNSWLITGELVSTPLEALCLEADVQSYNTCNNRLNMRAWKKALQSSDDHLKRLALTANIPQHLLNHCSFHCNANIFQHFWQLNSCTIK